MMFSLKKKENKLNTHLLHDDSVNMRVERQQQQCRSNDSGEIQEHQVIVVHNSNEQTAMGLDRSG